MNGVHDMGGMQNFGPVAPEAGEPWFHAAWERRAFALTLAMGGARVWNLDQTRAARESLPPAQYLASSSYQIWLDGLIKLMLERGLITREELAEGRMHEPPVRIPNVVTADKVAAALARGSPTARPLAGAARFRVGDAVRTKALNTPTHTRLPRYCRMHDMATRVSMAVACSFAPLHPRHCRRLVRSLPAGHSAENAARRAALHPEKAPHLRQLPLEPAAGLGPHRARFSAASLAPRFGGFRLQSAESPAPGSLGFDLLPVNLHTAAAGQVLLFPGF